MTLFWGSLKLIRVTICLVVFLTALESYWLAVHHFDFLNRQIYLAAMATTAAYAFANVQNDLLDVKTDLFNYPTRPLPAGEISIRQAQWLAAVLLLMSLLCSWLAGWVMFGFTIVMLGVTNIYNGWWKKTALLGKCSVALLSAATLLTGYLTVSSGDFPTIPFLVVFFFILAREFISTIADAPGDVAGGRMSIFILWGRTRVLQICLGLTLLAFGMLLAPLFLQTLRSPLCYALTIGLLSILPVLLAAVAIYRNQSATHIRTVSFQMRYVFFTSLVSFLWLI